MEQQAINRRVQKRIDQAGNGAQLPGTWCGTLGDNDAQPVYLAVGSRHSAILTGVRAIPSTLCPIENRVIRCIFSGLSLSSCFRPVELTRLIYLQCLCQLAGDDRMMILPCEFIGGADKIVGWLPTRGCSPLRQTDACADNGDSWPCLPDKVNAKYRPACKRGTIPSKLA